MTIRASVWHPTPSTVSWNMDGAKDFKSIADNDLIVLPRPSTGKSSQSKRVFQKRRRSRACDACRLRKTKCDAPPEGICSSCASASLLCKFTEPEDDRKKIGPARRLRMLEATVNDLNEKLRIAEAKLQSGGRSNDTTHEPQAVAFSGPFYRRDSVSTYDGDISPTTSTTSVAKSIEPKSPRNSISQGMSHLRLPYGDHEENDRFVGSTSGLGFLASVQEYVERLGYDTTSLLGAWKSSEARTYPYTPSMLQDGGQVTDLRVLLPSKRVGEKLLEIFHASAVRCLPIVYWPIILRKFQRACESPIFVADQASVTGVFCVLMMINAYASICSDDSEVLEAPSSQQKRGWHYYECARKYHDLNRPMFSLADAEVLLIMSLYLDLAALPSPSWMSVGSLARICQDLGLHRKSSEEKFCRVELEHRSRIFWTSFILDRKLALQSGRPPIFDEEEIDMDEPGTYDIADLVDQNNRMSSNGNKMPSGLVLMLQLIANARYIDPVLRLHITPGIEDQVEQQMLEVEQKLDAIERSFPDGMLDWENTSALDPILLKYALVPMATRLSMYRCFTDAKLARGLRTRCFIRSVEVAKSTVHLLERMKKTLGWERGFRLHQSEISYHHTFKVAIVFLLANDIFTKPFLVATSDEMRCCVDVLKAAASARPTVWQSLQLFDVVASILKNENVSQLLDTQSNVTTKQQYNTPYDGANAAAAALRDLASFSLPDVSASMSTSMPSSSLASQDTRMLDAMAPSTMTSADMQTDGILAPKFWPNLDASGRPSIGFSNPLTPSPNESTAWLTQVDPSYWTLMENVLSHDGQLNDRR